MCDVFYRVIRDHTSFGTASDRIWGSGDTTEMEGKGWEYSPQRGRLAFSPQACRVVCPGMRFVAPATTASFMLIMMGWGFAYGTVVGRIVAVGPGAMFGACERFHI